MPRTPAKFDKDEYCTPPEVLALVYAAIGIPDLDPCSNESALVVARQSFHKPKGALTEDWSRYVGKGSIFMNPPYSNTSEWVSKFFAWHRGHKDKQGVILLSAETGLVWWQEMLLPRIDRWIFLPRVAFLAEGKPVRGNRCNSALIYVGSEGKRIAHVWPKPVFRACR